MEDHKIKIQGKSIEEWNKSDENAKVANEVDAKNEEALKKILKKQGQ